MLLRKFIVKHSGKILWSMIVLYILFFVFLCLKKYYNFDYKLFDLAIFNQTFFNTLHGRWFQETVNIDIYLADHFPPIIFLLLPIYWLWQTPEMLLILQSVIIGLTAWPLYLIAKLVLKDKVIPLLVIFWWFLNPLLHNVNLYEFHQEVLAIFFVFWTFYFYKQNNFKIFLLFFVLSLLVREDISLILLGFFPLAILDKKSLVWKLTSLVLPLIYFFLSLKIIGHFSPVGSYKFFVFYGWLGGHDLLNIIWSWLTHPGQLILHILKPFSLLGIIYIFFLLLFLPLLRPKYLWLSVLPILQLFLRSAGFDQTAYLHQYPLLYLPGLFIAFIFAFKKIISQEDFWLSKFIKNNRYFFLIILFIIPLYFTIYFSSVPEILSKLYNHDEVNNKKDFLTLISPDSRVAVDAEFLPQLSSRQEIYRVKYAHIGKSQFLMKNFVLPQVDFILVNANSEDLNRCLGALENGSLAAKNLRAEAPSNWRKILSNYTLIKARDNLLLWQAKAETSQESLPLYERTSQGDNFLSQDFLVASELQKKAENNVLKLTFQPKVVEGEKYLIRFYKGDYYFNTPLDYNLWPMEEWSDKETVSFYYYLSPGVDGYQIFLSEELDILGIFKGHFFSVELKPLTEIINLYAS